MFVLFHASNRSHSSVQLLSKNEVRTQISLFLLSCDIFTVELVDFMASVAARLKIVIGGGNLKKFRLFQESYWVLNYAF